MSPTALAAALIALLLAQLIVRAYTGEAYACPVCGATKEDAHADECPWNVS